MIPLSCRWLLHRFCFSILKLCFSILKLFSARLLLRIKSVANELVLILKLNLVFSWFHFVFFVSNIGDFILYS